MAYPSICDVVKDNVAGNTVHKVFDPARRMGRGTQRLDLDATRHPTQPTLVASIHSEGDVRELFPKAQYTDSFGVKRWFDNKSSVKDNPRT